ncbi:MAG TPA: hypothetical protein VN457_04010, partial [Chlamydiales bacterium]|nr:hypothetical protein [Chlamydiales bacterium]
MSFLLPQCISDCLFGRAAAAAASSQPAAAKAEAAKEPSFKELLHLSDDRIVIEFADGPEIYDVSLLQQFPFFHFLSNANEKAKYMEHATGALLLKQFDRAAFRIAIELQIKKMPFHQVITKADLVRNPGLLESCDAVLNFLDPHPQEEQQKALEGIMESTKPLINVEWALAIVEAHDGKLPEPNQPGKGLEEEESSSSS